jgi:hypothetical protein
MHMNVDFFLCGHRRGPASTYYDIIIIISMLRLETLRSWALAYHCLTAYYEPCVQYAKYQRSATTYTTFTINDYVV